MNNPFYNWVGVILYRLFGIKTVAVRGVIERDRARYEQRQKWKVACWNIDKVTGTKKTFWSRVKGLF